MTLTSSQKYAWDKLENTTHNIFLTGPGGTGKSHVLNTWLARFDKHERERVKVVASTGAAALLVGGCTFHSFFGLGLGKGDPAAIINKATKRGDVINRISWCSTIIMDEVSMTPGKLFEYADKICRIIRKDNHPFGGIRIIAVGDFYQLPPIPEDGVKLTDWAFRSTSWEDCDFKMCNLAEIMRTTDESFMHVLAKIRVGAVDQEVRDFLNARVTKDTEFIEGTRLYGTREQVDRYNKYRLSQLPGDYIVFRTEYAGDSEYYQRLQNSMPIPDKLILKPGALVMIRKNFGGGIVNGTLAHVKEFKKIDGEDSLTLELLRGGIVHLGKCRFEWLDSNGYSLASAYNFPISVAYACTIHKAQGASIDSVICDIENVWDSGQAYVALSRAKDPKQLYIEHWRQDSIHASDEVTDFYELMEALG